MYAMLFLQRSMQVHCGYMGYAVQYLWPSCHESKQVPLLVTFQHRSKLRILTANFRETLQTSAKIMASIVFRRSQTKEEMQNLERCSSHLRVHANI